MENTLENNSGYSTSYNDDYETCEHTRVCFCIYTPHRDPYTISDLLGISPAKVQALGEKRTSVKGNEWAVPKNLWALESEDHVDSKDLRRHLDWALAILLPVKNAILGLQKEQDTTMVMRCYWWSASGQGGPILWPAQMNGLAELNIECAFEIGFYGDEDD
jgi:hypothetical protein